MRVLQEGEVLRPLGPQEIGWHALFVGADGASMLQYSLIVDSDSRLQPEHVQTVLDVLQREIPMLRTRVASIDNVLHLVAGPCPSVQLTVLPPGGDWLQQHQRLLQEQKIDPAAGPLWTVCLLHDPVNIAPPAAPSHRAVLYLSLCHTITDGVSNAMLCGRLLRHLDRATRGLAVDAAEPTPIYPSVEQLLRDQTPGWSWSLLWTTIGGLLARLVDGGGKHKLLDRYVRPYDGSRPAAYSTATVAASMAAGELARLRALCRANGVSLNAALSAAVSFAGARMAGAGSDAAASLPTLWLVDARRYLPAADAMHLSTVAGVALDVRIEHADVCEFWSVAEALGRELRRKLNAREPLARMRAAGWPGAGSHAAGCLYSINNVGSLDRLLPRRGAVRAVALHRAVKAQPALADSFGSHCFQTVAGALCYDLNYVRGRVADADAERFSRLVVEILAEVSTPGGDETDCE